MGYSWSGLYDAHGGFYRLNYLKGNQKEYAIVDIDFADETTHSFSRIHGGPDNTTIFRVDDNKITHSSQPELFKQEEKVIGTNSVDAYAYNIQVLSAYKQRDLKGTENDYVI